MRPDTRNLKPRKKIAPLVLLLLVLVTMIVVLPAGAVTVPAAKINLIVDGPEKEATILADTAQQLETWLTVMLRDKPAVDRRIMVRIGTDLPPPTDQLGLNLSPESTTWNAVQELALRLVTRRAMALQEDGAGPLGALDWLAAAASYRIVNMNFKPELIRANPSLALSMLSGASPFPVKTVLENPLPATFEVPFLLYARYCHLLTAVVELSGNAKDNRLRRVLELEAAGRPPLAAMELTMGDDFHSGEDLQAWFERKLGHLNWLNQESHSADDIARRLPELETLPEVKPGPDGAFGCTMVNMDEISRETREYQLDQNGLANRIKDFTLLHKQAPPLLRPALAKYIEALTDLSKGKNRKFQKLFKEAREEFGAARERQRKISEFLDTLENRQPQLPRSLEPFMTVLDENYRRQRELAPALQEYLDSLD